MAEISKLNLTGSDLDIKDSVARDKLTVVDPTAGEGLITFGVDANGNYGYKKVGADTVTPFKTGGSNYDIFAGSFETATSGGFYPRNVYIASNARAHVLLPFSFRKGLLILAVAGVNVNTVLPLRLYKTAYNSGSTYYSGTITKLNFAGGTYDNSCQLYLANVELNTDVSNFYLGLTSSSNGFYLLSATILSET